MICPNKIYALEEVGGGSFFIVVHFLTDILSTSPSYGVQSML